MLYMVKQYSIYVSWFLLLQTAEAWNNILAAVDEIQKKSCIQFRMKKDGDDHFIRFVKKNG